MVEVASNVADGRGVDDGQNGALVAKVFVDPVNEVVPASQSVVLVASFSL